MALAAYRHLLRSIRIAFEGDTNVLLAARSQARAGFEGSRHLASEGSNTLQGIAHAEQIAKFLRENLVQGRRGDLDSGSYELRLHEYTERGDNDSIKTPGNGTLEGLRCCSL